MRPHGQYVKPSFATACIKALTPADEAKTKGKLAIGKVIPLAQ